MQLRGVDGQSLLLYKVVTEWLTALGAGIHISSNLLLGNLYSSSLKTSFWSRLLCRWWSGHDCSMRHPILLC